MIFFDEQGTRWQKIKRTTAGFATAIGLPSAAILGGIALYQPQWGILHIPQPSAPHTQHPRSTPTASFVEPALQAPLVTSFTQSRSAKPSASAPSAAQATLTANSTPTSSTSSAPTTTPVTTTTPLPTQPTATTLPGNSTYGRGHTPTH